MLKGFSIIICCYNSAKLLPDTLNYIYKLSLPEGSGAEILIVDNNSDDNTSSVAEILLQSPENKISYKILKQPVQGITPSRLKGISESSYEYIIFCDDDNQLQKDYLEISDRIMNDNKDTAILGGESKAISSIDFPKWFEKFSNHYASGKQSDIDGDVTDQGEIWGAGMVIRKEALDEILSEGFKPILNDRTGNKLLSGGDTELCFALRLSGKNIRYDSDLKLKHFINPDKLNWKYLRKLNRGFGIQKVYLDAYMCAYNNTEILSWEDEAKEILKKIKKTGVLKTSGSFFLKEGNPDALKIEKLKGKLSELLKIRNTYKENYEKIVAANWNKRKININPKTNNK